MRFLFLSLLGVASALFSGPAWADTLPGAPKVLIVMSGADEVALTDNATLKTGYFLRELTDNLKQILDAGFEVTFASPEVTKGSPNGKRPTVDEFSKEPMWYTYPFSLDPLKPVKRVREALRLVESRTSNLGDLHQPLSMESLTEDQLKGFAGVFVPGGHAPVTDLINNPTMGRILKHFHAAGKPTGLICHAPIALLSSRESGKPWIYAGYHVSVATKAEEQLMEVLGPMAPHRLNFDVAGTKEHYVDEALQKAGVSLRQNPLPSFPRITQDKELITGQNPNSAEHMGVLFVNAVRGGSLQSFHELRSLSQSDLRTLFNKGTLGQEPAVEPDLTLPEGDAAGLPLLIPDNATKLNPAELFFPSDFTLNEFATLFWGGKIFTLKEGGQEGTLLNKILPLQVNGVAGTGYDGLHLINARYYVGNLTTELQKKEGTILPGVIPGQNARVDGKPSIILNYSVARIPLARGIIDEIRPVLSHKYPGLYLGRATSRDGKFWCYFALQFPVQK